MESLYYMLVGCSVMTLYVGAIAVLVHGSVKILEIVKGKIVSARR